MLVSTQPTRIRRIASHDLRANLDATLRHTVPKPVAQRETSKSKDRRQATVLFADISGFTALSEKMDPEDVADAMNACFEAASS